MRAFIGLLLLTAAPAITPTSPPPAAVNAAPASPDYAKSSSWAARPGAEGFAAAVARGASPAASKSKVDIFYVSPTTYRSTDRWNLDITDPAEKDWMDRSVVARQAAIFNGCCRLFAPRYRQASRRAFLHMATGGEQAFALAYGDVLRAFDSYLAHDNHGRGFILVGHSQGARHVAQLLEDRIDRSTLQRQLIAAYVVGVDMVEGDFGTRYKSLKPCATPTATGCVIAWNSVLPTLDRVAAGKGNAARFVARYGDGPGARPLCINPPTSDRSKAAAPAALSRGAVPGDPDASEIQPLRAHSVAAQCKDGFLVVDPASSLSLKPLPGGSMHYHDLGLFYVDIRLNAHRRANAWLARR